MDCHKVLGPQGKVEMDDLSKGGYCACFIGLFAHGKVFNLNLKIYQNFIFKRLC